MSAIRLFAALAAVLALTACGDPDPVPGPADASEHADAGLEVTPDAGGEPDAGEAADASEGFDSGTEPIPDAGIEDAGAEDAGEQDAGEPQLEQEPNDGAADDEINAITLPLAIAGAIDPAADTDILGFVPTPGDLWTWRLEPLGASLAPHLAVFQGANSVPVLVAQGGPGETIEQEQLVLGGGQWYAAVRDARNVASSANLGGADYGWLLEVRGESRAPQPVSFPATVQGSLAHPFAMALFGFHAAPSFTFDIDLRADRKSPRSDMDSRMSLFNATARQWVHTNDDMQNTTDSHIGGDGLPSEGDYWILVENIKPDAADLSFELVLTTR